MTNILMKNKANNVISRIEQIKKPRSIFPIGRSRKMTMKASYLYPILAEEVIPADTWILDCNYFIRLNTQLTAPIDNLWVFLYFFFDPYRLAWDNFTKQQGERRNPDDNIDFITPAITSKSGFAVGSLYDYFGGIRTGIANSKITCYFARTYNRIFNQYFRDQDLQDEAPEYYDDADRADTEYKLLKKCKMHDYFTDATVSTQKGPAVMIPLGLEAPVTGDVIGNGKALGLGGNRAMANTTNNSNRLLLNATGAGSAAGTGNSQKLVNENILVGVTNDPSKSGLTLAANAKAILSDAVAASVTAVRLAIRTQEIFEADNRGGTRYTEMLQHRYGAINPDLRLGRVQYLGGMQKPLFTNPVVQTSGTGSTGQTTPQGNIAGYGTVSDGGNVVKASFGEFGSLMGLACITAVPQYQQGMHKKHQRWERFDYWYPEFSSLTDQAITNGEIFYQGTEEDDEPWGYIGRGDEYRYFNNEICGELRSEYQYTLDPWHYAEKFEDLPQLNASFIEDKTDQILKRTLAVKTDDEGDAEQFICDFEFEGLVARVLPAKATPQTGGRLL